MNRIVNSIKIVLFMFLTISCNKESINNRDLVEVGFKLNMPLNVQQPVKTYAISSSDENLIYQIILLAFKVSSGTEKLAYYKEGMQIYAGATPNEKSFYTRLVKSTDTYRFVLLINGGDQISDIVENIPLNTEKEDIMEQLVYSVTQKWDTTPSSFTPLPMWGESGEVSGINAQTVLSNISLMRSLARADITLSGTALTDFAIESVRVYSENDKLLMAPLPANLDMSSRPVAPSIPDDAAPLALAQEYSYSGATSVVRDIYIPEAKAGDTWLVIGGKLGGDPAIHYYRADFEDSGSMPVPLLRNTKYIINITQVNTAGETDPDNLSVHIPLRNNVSSHLKAITQIQYEKN